MRVLALAPLGHPVLRTVCDAVSRAEAGTVRGLVEDLTTTLVDSGQAGLSAPQVYVPRQVCVVRPLADDRIKIHALLNPVVEATSKATLAHWERCLSFPGHLVRVERHVEVRVRFMDLQGEERAVEAAGFDAALLQHEVDHLQGRLVLDRIQSSADIVSDKAYDVFHYMDDDDGMMAIECEFAQVL